MGTPPRWPVLFLLSIEARTDYSSRRSRISKKSLMQPSMRSRHRRSRGLRPGTGSTGYTRRKSEHLSPNPSDDVADLVADLGTATNSAGFAAPDRRETRADATGSRSGSTKVIALRIEGNIRQSQTKISRSMFRSRTWDRALRLSTITS
jgi:hypothetical protein